MKIWHITKTIYGGSGQYAFRLSNALNDLGHQSTVLVAEGDITPRVEGLSYQSNTLQKLINRGMVSVIGRAAKAPFHSGHRLDRWNSNHYIKPTDIVHLHGMTGWIGFSGLRSLIPPRTRVFWTAHDLWMLSGGCVVYRDCNNYQSGCKSCPILKQPFSRWSQVEWKRKAQFIRDYQITPIANSTWMADKIRKSAIFSDIEDVAVIPPIVASEFFEADSFPSLRKELQIPSDRIVLGLGARSLTDIYKGIPEFLQYFVQEEDLIDKCTLLLCGDGKIDVPNDLDCRFLGTLTNTKEIARFYSACDIFVSPSRMETFGMTLLEAQAAGTPVVAFHVGGTPEAVNHLKHGWLAQENNYQEIMAGLRWLLSNLKQNASIGFCASRWVAENHSSTVLGKKQVHTYKGKSTLVLR